MAVRTKPASRPGTADTGQRCRRLRIFNVVAGVLLAAEGVYMLLTSNDLALPVTASFLRTDPVAATGGRLRATYPYSSSHPLVSRL